MKKQQPYRIKSISQFHQFRNLPSPLHPLISIIDVSGSKKIYDDEPKSLLFDFYSISMKSIRNAKIKYGQQTMDFDNGVMSFTAPGQVIGVEAEEGNILKQSGWLLLVHPDFFWKTPLLKKIKQYEFFDYAVNEALFVSESEATIINGIINRVQEESNKNIDQFSHEIILTHLESLLAYSERFYHRQFLTRRKVNHQILDRLNHILDNFFDENNISKNGLPTVSLVAEQLNISPHYLSGLLKSLTGMNTQQHIHEKLIEKAKEKLSTTNITVSEIAYELGFEHLASFSKLFKAKTNQTPLEFRQSFN